MTDYINRNSAIEGIEYEVIRIAKMLPDSENTRNLIKGAKDSIDILKHMPSVDAIDVVRCKDCEYGVVDDPDFPDQYFCEYDGGRWNCGEWFCAAGERRKR